MTFLQTSINLVTSFQIFLSLIYTLTIPFDTPMFSFPKPLTPRYLKTGCHRRREHIISQRVMAAGVIQVCRRTTLPL